ncbi:MAG: AAA family ATPase [Actinomycetota bacterium]|nr:AAA family ATPase [Actinomycetota bacterium]
MSALDDLVRQRSIIVCCGSGGVGKTTTAAALALEAARQGRRACVVTIDPAKRLADALGLESLSNVPGRIPGDWPGCLDALMLDTKSTFDSLVTTYAATPEQAEAILANRLYRNMAGALSGTQEYMAMEKLHELAAGGAYDLIVIDTPPTRNALDFLDAPRRLTRFLDNRIFKLLMLPTRAYLKAVSFATQAFLRTISKVVGGEVVADAVAFFQAFEGMEEGFRNRAAEVLAMLKDSGTAFVLVTSPRRDAVEEAAFFADKLGESEIAVDGLVVNRVHPSFGTAPVPSAELGDLAINLADFRRIAEREEHHVAALASRIAPAPVGRVPFLVDDVHDLDGLAVVGTHLFGAGSPTPGSTRG